MRIFPSCGVPETTGEELLTGAPAAHPTPVDVGGVTTEGHRLAPSAAIFPDISTFAFGAPTVPNVVGDEQNIFEDQRGAPPAVTDSSV